MFHLEMTTGWSDIPGTSGVSTKPLSGGLDEAAGKGFRTRCVRISPGGETFEPFVHPYWEEVFLLQGELTSKPDRATVDAPGYVIRPPGTPHGPLLSSTGCLLIEFQYFSERAIGMSDHLDNLAPDSTA